MNTVQTSSKPQQLALYYSELCYFCHKVRKCLDELKLDIELRDVVGIATNRSELIAGGGKSQVPCLRLQYADGRIEWMYESDDICAWLRRNYGDAP